MFRPVCIVGIGPLKKPKLLDLKSIIGTVQCYFCVVVETEKCESNTSQDKSEVPTEHTLEACVWWLVSLLALLVEPPQACERGRPCFYKEIV